ncbi:hypothetical protein BRCON_2000 [Candidatus Sumerlaea chitinivorans]|uniref:Uncharacterized protein n=1 Tax=Sumerlaea chitinivorans TaxID=2250252 RepID=A0A2Z4Y6C1_SUMC1|nr:hypothetical protein BRCON_2000 [Candidatus Sumerlaea chitinivorans]
MTTSREKRITFLKIVKTLFATGADMKVHLVAPLQPLGVK